MPAKAQRRASLTDADYAALKAEVRALMIESARAGETITYSELCARLQTARVHYHSFLLAHLLDEIGYAESEAGRGALPAVVVRKSSGIPGGGYFSGMDGVDADALEQMWRDDFESVCAYWQDHPDD